MMTKALPATVLTAIEHRLHELKAQLDDPASSHRFHPLRDAITTLRRKYRLTFSDIVAELKAAGVADVTLGEVKKYLRLIGATKPRAARTRV
jgi:hypothetical protein